MAPQRSLLIHMRLLSLSFRCTQFCAWVAAEYRDASPEQRARLRLGARCPFVDLHEMGHARPGSLLLCWAILNAIASFLCALAALRFVSWLSLRAVLIHLPHPSFAGVSCVLCFPVILLRCFRHVLRYDPQDRGVHRPGSLDPLKCLAVGCRSRCHVCVYWLAAFSCCRRGLALATCRAQLHRCQRTVPSHGALDRSYAYAPGCEGSSAQRGAHGWRSRLGGDLKRPLPAFLVCDCGPFSRALPYTPICVRFRVLPFNFCLFARFHTFAFASVRFLLHCLLRCVSTGVNSELVVCFIGALAPKGLSMGDMGAKSCGFEYKSSIFQSVKRNTNHHSATHELVPKTKESKGQGANTNKQTRKSKQAFRKL